MPKAVTIKKSKYIKNNELNRNNDVPKSVDLFDVPNNVFVDDNGVHSSGNKQAQGQQESEIEREGTRLFQKDTQCDNERSKTRGWKNGEQRNGVEKNVQSRSHENKSFNGEEQCGERTTESSGYGKRKTGTRKKINSSAGGSIEKGKQNLKGDGGSKKGEDRIQEERLTPSGFKRGEFQESATIMPYKTIIHGPYPTDDFFCVDIVLDDGLVYRVSTCSVKDGKYIQGFDSRFIVRKFRQHLK